MQNGLLVDCRLLLKSCGNRMAYAGAPQLQNRDNILFCPAWSYGPPFIRS